MDFKKATDSLFSNVSHDDLAKSLGVSIASVRQARLDPEAKAHRSPPSKWERAVIELAADRVRQYRKLISALEAEQQRSLFDDAPGSKEAS